MRSDSVCERSNSIYNNSYSDNDTISILREAIRSAERNSNVSGFWFDQQIRSSVMQNDEWGVVIQTEQILIDRKINSVRKVYLTNSKYRVGWIIDCDLNTCMVCLNSFNLFRRKHHCRSCGYLVCHKCSPHQINVPNIEEDGGSRVCKNCFALKSESNSPKSTPSQKGDRESTPEHLNSPIGTVRRRLITSTSGKAAITLPIDALMSNDIELYEKLQEPKYEEAYRCSRNIFFLKSWYSFTCLCQENAGDHSLGHLQEQPLEIARARAAESHRR